MRSLMERSTKFMSLSGVASIAAGIYALTGAFIAYKFFPFDPGQIVDGSIQPGTLTPELRKRSLVFVTNNGGIQTAANLYFIASWHSCSISATSVVGFKHVLSMCEAKFIKQTYSTMPQLQMLLTP